MDFLLIIALALVALWTGRMARSKGRSPWLWSGASFFMGIAPFAVHLLAVVPLVILLFVKNPQPTRETEEFASCPRCQTTATRRTRYCISCGWEMARLYNQDATDVQEQPETASLKQESESPQPEAETKSPPEVAPTVASTAASTEKPTSQSPGPPVNESAEPPITQPTAASTAEEPSSANAPVEKPEEAPSGEAGGAQEAPKNAPIYRKPVPVDAPTASAMTERGVQLFNQGRTQESIDQFTKAMALDPTYIEAWAKRAEAYALLGRGEQAAEDQRRLDALNAGSSGG